MTVSDIICNLQQFNIQLQYEAGQLKLEIPTGKAVPYQLINEVQSRKTEIINYIKLNGTQQPSFVSENSANNIKLNS